MNGITQNTFKDADVDTKLNILFDYQKNTHENIHLIREAMELHPTDCPIRFEKLEKKRIKDTWLFALLALIGGLIGGAGKSFKWW